MDLGAHAHFPRFHAAVLAINVEQVVFGLSPDKEVVTLEVIGAKFKVDEGLELAIPSRRANIDIAPDAWTAEQQSSNDQHEGLTFDYGRNHLSLAATPDYSLFRVRFESCASLELVSPSPRLVYGIADGCLRELWVLNPTRSAME